MFHWLEHWVAGVLKCPQDSILLCQKWLLSGSKSRVGFGVECQPLTLLSQGLLSRRQARSQSIHFGLLNVEREPKMSTQIRRERALFPVHRRLRRCAIGDENNETSCSEKEKAKTWEILADGSRWRVSTPSTACNCVEQCGTNEKSIFSPSSLRRWQIIPPLFWKNLVITQWLQKTGVLPRCINSQTQLS